MRPFHEVAAHNQARHERENMRNLEAENKLLRELLENSNSLVGWQQEELLKLKAVISDMGNPISGAALVGGNKKNE